jgi:hypothetical protein
MRFGSYERKGGEGRIGCWERVKKIYKRVILGVL